MPQPSLTGDFAPEAPSAGLAQSFALVALERVRGHQCKTTKNFFQQKAKVSTEERTAKLKSIYELKQSSHFAHAPIATHPRGPPCSRGGPHDYDSHTAGNPSP